MSIKKKTVFYAFGILLSVLFFAYIVFALLADSKLAAAKLAIKEAGYPTKMSELISAPVADDDNAAILYESARNLLKAEGWDMLLDTIEDPSQLSLEELPKVRAFLKRDGVQRVIKILQESATKPNCQFTIDFSAGPGVPLPYLSRDISTLLVGKFQVEIAREDYRQALNALNMGFDYSKKLFNEPILITHLIACNDLSLLLQKRQLLAVFKPAYPDVMLSELSTNNIRASFLNAVHGERLLMVDWIFHPENLKETQREIGRNNLWNSWYAMTPLWQLEHAACLQYFINAINYCKQPYTIKKLKSTISHSSYLNDILISDYSIPLITSLRTCAQLEITKAGLAVLKYQHEHTTYPKALSEVGTFIDPFTDKPLLYSSNEHGFEISSLGEKLDSNDKKAPRWLYAQP